MSVSHSKKCCEGVVNNRWMEYREDYQAAEAEALKYRQNGGQEYDSCGDAPDKRERENGR